VLANVFYVTGEPEELHGLKPAPIHLFRDGKHGSRPHAQRPETQLSVAQSRIDDMNLIHAIAQRSAAYFDVTINITWCLGRSRTIFMLIGLLMMAVPQVDTNLPIE